MKREAPADFRHHPPAHGSPEDRGSADAYYGRPFDPHKWLDALGRERVTLTDPGEIEDYRRGYLDETDRKDWS